MNKGYSCTMEKNPVEEICPLCGSDIYINKYGTDYCCLNKECVLNKNMSNVIKDIQKVMQFYWDFNKQFK